MKWVLLIAVCLGAIGVGLFSALFGGVLALLLVVPILVLLFIFKDYRVGVISLLFLLPWAASPLLPQAQGLNIINYLVLASLLSFSVHAVFTRKVIVGVPSQLVWFYLLPLSLGVLLAIPHLSEAVRNYAGTEESLSYSMGEFLKGRYLKPLGYVIFAFLLGNAVRDSARPERFVTAFVLAGLVPALVVFALVAISRVSLSDLQAQRSFMGPIGLHANEMAAMLAFVLGPMVFVLPTWRGVIAKTLAAVALVLVLAALLLTFSRGGFIAMCIVMVIFMLHQRRCLSMLISMSVLVLGLLFAPAAVKERLMTGVESGAVSYSVGNLSDPLTAGRVAVWERLLPEVKRSPVWGRGLGSTAWSDLVRSGVYRATHPHNLYLALLLDLGALGLAAVLYWYYTILKAQNMLRRAPDVPPRLQEFFTGAMAGLAGLLVMSVTNGNYTPKPEYTFFWFALGMTFAYWPRSQAINRKLADSTWKTESGAAATTDLGLSR